MKKTNEVELGIICRREKVEVLFEKVLGDFQKYFTNIANKYQEKYKEQYKELMIENIYQLNSLNAEEQFLSVEVYVYYNEKIAEASTDLNDLKQKIEFEISLDSFGEMIDMEHEASFNVSLIQAQIADERARQSLLRSKYISSPFIKGGI